MDGDVGILKRVYDRFNARDVDAVLAVLADDVAWANGMDGGHVYGREAVRCTGRASGPSSVRTSSLWAFSELRMARSSRKSGSPSAISKANRSRGRPTGLETRRSDTFSVCETARSLASTFRMLPDHSQKSGLSAVGTAVGLPGKCPSGFSAHTISGHSPNGRR
jgi:hypothetical protein